MSFKKSRIKLEDIARKLNLSIATVSRALDKNPRVKPSTQERVLKTAEKMGYMPNQIAKSLSSGKTNIIGVIIPRYDEPFFIEVCRGIDHYAREHNYKILISSSRNSFEFEKENLISFERGLVDGIILSPTHETEIFTHIKNIVKKDIPIVLFDNIKEHVPGADHVVIDDIQATYDGVKHLIEKGRKNIAYIGGLEQKKVFQDRYKGYLKTLEDHNLPVHNEIIFHCNSYERKVEENEIENFLKNLKKPIDAVFTCTDNYGIIAIKKLSKLGYKIPEDISVVGFGDVGMGNIVIPSLTSVFQPSFEMGEVSAKLLLEQINNTSEKKHQKKVIKLTTNLKIRESS